MNIDMNGFAKSVGKSREYLEFTFIYASRAAAVASWFCS